GSQSSRSAKAPIMVDDFDRGLTAPAPQSGDVESRPRGQFNRRHYRTLESQGRLRQSRVIEKNHNGSLELSRQIDGVQLEVNRPFSARGQRPSAFQSLMVNICQL